MRKPKYASLRELFRSSKRWTKGTFARNIAQKEVSAISPKAVCWCLIGGIRYCYPNGLEAEVVTETLKEAIKKMFYNTNIVEFNDQTAKSIKDIQAVVREARV